MHQVLYVYHKHSLALQLHPIFGGQKHLYIYIYFIGPRPFSGQRCQ